MSTDKEEPFGARSKRDWEEHGPVSGVRRPRVSLPRTCCATLGASCSISTQPSTLRSPIWLGQTPLEQRLSAFVQSSKALIKVAKPVTHGHQGIPMSLTSFSLWPKPHTSQLEGPAVPVQEMGCGCPMLPLGV